MAERDSLITVLRDPYRSRRDKALTLGLAALLWTMNAAQTVLAIIGVLALFGGWC